MYIKKTPETIDFFNYDKINIDTFVCDQVYINKNLHHLNYGLLPIYEYPTGFFIRCLNYIVKGVPYDLSMYHFMIHFNYTVASLNKVDLIKELRSWYIR